MLFVRKLVFLFSLILLLPAAWPAGPQSLPGTAEGCLGGRLDSPIRIDLFSDFQCSHCRAFYMDTIKQVLKDYSAQDKVCVVYHEFPLAMHKYAREAARWSVATRKVGRKQWLAVVDALYTRQPEWAQSGKVEATVAAALSADDYTNVKRILLKPEIDDIVAGDIALGLKHKIESTPTLFVYAVGREQKLVGGIPYPVLKDFFDKIVR
jgi:protein-disulfide isomerase